MRILEKEDQTIGSIFLGGVFLIPIILIVWSEPETQEILRKWIQITIPALISISLFYLGDQTQKKSQRELKEQQEVNDYKTYLDQTLKYLSQCNFQNQQSIDSSVEFQIVKSLATTALKEFNLKRKNQLIAFFQSLNSENTL